MRAYVDRKGRILFVHDGISNGRWWATYYRLPNGSLKRYVSPHLPSRTNKADAQDNLDRYARRRRWHEADIPVCRVCGCTDDNACPGGCCWVEDPEGLGDLCSACFARMYPGMEGNA